MFITFEGGEGAGKTTQAALLERRLSAEGYSVLRLREPGGTELGDHLRAWLKSAQGQMSPEAELLLFGGARAELVRSVLRPAFESGTIIVLDRYADSTTAYQGYGRGLPLPTVRTVNDLAVQGLWPDLTVLLDAPPESGLARAAGRGDASDERRFEEAGVAFHERVREGFLRLAAEGPERWLVLDARAPIADVADRVWERVRGLLQQTLNGRSAPGNPAGSP